MKTQPKPFYAQGQAVGRRPPKACHQAPQPADTSEVLDAAFVKWKDAIPLRETMAKSEKKMMIQPDNGFRNGQGGVTLTSVMQRILAYPIESKSPLESMAFLADVKRQFRYVSNATLRRMEVKLPKLKDKTPEQVRCSLNSFLGLLSHYRSYNIRRKMFYHLDVYQYGHYLRWMRKYVLNHSLSDTFT